ncbi:MAG TPA: thioesterase family protein [Acidimicrobiia bacterium]|nr:thioesterase family protein [Acidimicrobiia bacterium]
MEPVTPFDQETAVRCIDADRYEADMSTAWWVARGPNGGYLAAVILRALAATVDDPQRSPRSLTVHYASPPTEGTVRLITTRERVGRSLTTVTCRTEQDGRLVALAVAAFSAPRPGPEFCDVVMPQVPGPEAFVPRPLPAEAPPIARRWDTRWAIGRPPVPGAPGTGGWIRLPEVRSVDALVAAAMTDGWIPPMLGRIQEPAIVPTVDLTIHFRSELPHPGLAPDAYVLAVFRTRAAAGGFLEEDGEIWAPDGTLLAQSRQLATILPFSF